MSDATTSSITHRSAKRRVVRGIDDRDKLLQVESGQSFIDYVSTARRKHQNVLRSLHLALATLQQVCEDIQDALRVLEEDLQ